jgi:hypothetical protein
MSEKKDPPMFKKIDWDSVVKAGSNGYMYVTTVPTDELPDGHPFGERRKDRKRRYVYLHRAVYELEHGSYIHPELGDQVDHKDGNKNNNDPSNLVLVKLGDHQKSHCNDRGNHFWKTSPLNKKHKKASDMHETAIRVVISYLKSF